LTTIGALVAGIARTLINFGARPSVVLQPGDEAPLFELPGSDGRIYRLRDLRGRAVVLAWFPKAFTGG
jgi:peroxiredoxin Q/BCP